VTFLDLFAGIGGFRRGLERSGHSCIGHVEIDKYANKSYMAMYQLEYCPYGYQSTSNTCMLCNSEVMKNCDGKTTNCKGEWYAKDIEKITTGEIPRAEIWTFGFPCTDISLSGKRAGLAGKRSGLFFTVISLLKSQSPENRPSELVIENVKHLLSSQRGGDFTTVLSELWEAGYDAEWMCVNSKDYGVPQHRERVYIIGHLRRKSCRKVFPVTGANLATIKRVIDGSQGKRVYDVSGLSITLTATGGGFGGRTGLYTTVEESEPYCVRAVITPGRMSKRQNGRRIKEAGEPAFTLTCQDQHGILICGRIRRLTPRESWRLQAFEDELFERARAVGISDAQLYKQAGNAVTVNIVYVIGLRLKGGEVY